MRAKRAVMMLAAVLAAVVLATKFVMRVASASRLSFARPMLFPVARFVNPTVRPGRTIIANVQPVKLAIMGDALRTALH